MAGFERSEGIWRPSVGIWAVALLSLVLLAACSSEEESSSGATAASAGKTSSVPTASPSPSAVETVTASAERSPAELIEAGRSVYNANCIACHGIDPTRDGALGPAVAGSSLELLTARVLRAEYPPGYEPKRPSRVMVALPHLEPKLPELAAYLQSL